MAGQVVQITINVTDGNAAEAVQQVVAQLEALGPAGEAAGAQAGAGLDQISGHALTSLDNVRLLRDDLGIHIPRSMERAIAQSELLSTAIGGMGSGLLALGAVELFAHIGEEIYNTYEKYLSLNAAQDEYNKKLSEAQDKDFINPHSLDVAVQRLNQATAAAEQYRQVAQEVSKPDGFTWGGLGMAMLGPIGAYSQAFDAFDKMRQGSSNSAESVKKQEQADALHARQLEMQHELTLAQIETSHAGDSVLKGEGKITAELNAQLEKRRENTHYQGQLDNLLNTTPGAVRGWTPDIARSSPVAGNPMEAAQDEAARKKAAADEIELHRQETQELIAMQNEAVNAGLEGNALRAAQEQQSIEAVVRKFQEGEIGKQTGIEETWAIQDKFNAMALKQQEELDAQTKHMADEAAQSGLKGLQLINAQLWTNLDSINAAENKAVGPNGIETGAQSEDFASQRASAWQTSNQKITESQEQFNERIKALTQSADDSQAQGYARIEEEEQKRLTDLMKFYSEEYGKDQGAWAGYQAQKQRIEADAESQMQQLHEKNMEAVTKQEQEAARLGLAEWKQADLAIQDSSEDRIRAIDDAEAQQLAHVKQYSDAARMIQMDADAQRVASNALANAEMQKQDEETRDKLASGLQSLFEHPEQFFEKRAMDTAFQLMANEMLSTFKSSSPAGGMLQFLFGMGPQMSTSTNPEDAIKSALGMGGGTSTASSMQFQQGSTTLLTGSQMLLQASTALQSAAGSMSLGGGGAAGMGGGGFGMLGSTGGAGGDGSSAAALAGMPSYSTGSGMVGSSPMPETTMDPMAGTLNADGSFTSANGAASLGKGGALLGGSLTAATGIYSAFKDSNPIAGAASGAMGGAEIGSLFGPVGTGIGATVGAIGGALAGIFGDRGRGNAESLDVNTIQPELTKDLQGYEAGQTGYNAIASSLSSMLISAQNSTNSMGSGARSYFNNNIAPEINAVLSSLQKQERGGRSAVTLSAGQYHSGGTIGDFGDLATSDTEGFIHAMQGETVMNPAATAAHAPILQAMNSGTNFAYASSVPARMPASSGGGGSNITIQAIDAKSVAQWAKGGGGRALVSAMNQAQTQYSGVGR